MSTTETKPELKDGRVVAIAGPVLDAEFPHDHLPEINTAVEMTIVEDGRETLITGEVAQQIGDSRVRVVCLETDRRLDSRRAPYATPAPASRCPWAQPCSVTSSTSSAKRSTSIRSRVSTNAGTSIVRRRCSRI